ncbi:hypothetical protein [Tepidibacillus fermentans]
MLDQSNLSSPHFSFNHLFI